jgi:hypothetical protein
MRWRVEFTFRTATGKPDRDQVDVNAETKTEAAINARKVLKGYGIKGARNLKPRELQEHETFSEAMPKSDEYRLAETLKEVTEVLERVTGNSSSAYQIFREVGGVGVVANVKAILAQYKLINK